jgi:hypothetical protein
LPAPDEIEIRAAVSAEAEPKAPRRRPGRWILRVLAGGIALVWLEAVASRPLPSVEGGSVLGPAFRAKGVVHIHTSLSDGRGSTAEVVSAARRKGLDFIVITDHNRADAEALNALAAEPGGPVVIVGSEVSTEAGHVLAIGIRPPAFRFSGTLREVLDDIRHLGGCAFVAHPTSPRAETSFTRENEPGSWGIEVVNGDSAAREAPPLALALAALRYPVNPSLSLGRTLGSFDPERALWDRLLSRRYAPAIGGADAHGRIPLTRTTSLPIPSYEALFGLVHTVVNLSEPLPGNKVVAQRRIVQALCAGESSIAIPTLADPMDFYFVARRADGSMASSGATVRFEPGLTILAGGSMPEEATVRLIESGRTLEEKSKIDFAVARPGVYRVEARVKGRSTPWILSNPISILTAESERERARSAEPARVAYIEGATMIDRFEGPTPFGAEHDKGSTVFEPILDPAGGRGRGAAARLSFRLNDKTVPPVWCALVDRSKRDLSAGQGVSFWMRADGEYRVWFQIRDQNPRSADEGTEAWFASVRTSTAWTLHTIPFASLRSINRTTDGAFDPSRVTHLVFVIDHGAMPYGSVGKVWIDDLALY